MNLYYRRSAYFRLVIPVVDSNTTKVSDSTKYLVNDENVEFRNGLFPWLNASFPSEILKIIFETQEHFLDLRIWCLSLLDVPSKAVFTKTFERVS